MAYTELVECLTSVGKPSGFAPRSSRAFSTLIAMSPQGACCVTRLSSLRSNAPVGLGVLELPLLEPPLAVSTLRVSGSTDLVSLSFSALVLVSSFGSLTPLESLQAEQMRSANRGRIEKCLIMASPFWIPAKSESPRLAPGGDPLG